MPMKIKSQNSEKQLALVSDINKVIATWSRDNSDGQLSINHISASKLQSGIVWIHCATQTTKALTNGSEVWLGTLPAGFLPIWSIYNYPIIDGKVNLTINGSANRADLLFIPNKNIAVNHNLCFDLLYFTR